MIIKRGMVIDINLEPVKGSETGKTRPCIIVTNDVYNERLVKVRGKISDKDLNSIDLALRLVFDLI